MITETNRACEDVTGFPSRELRGRHVWSVLSTPKQTDQFQQVLEKLKKRPVSLEYESCLLTKHSQRRHISWACSPMLDGQDNLSSIIMTGIDVTARIAAEQRASQAERNVEEMRLANKKPTADEGLSGKVEAQLQNVFEQMPTGDKADRRKRPRRSYPYVQRIAPIIDGKLPHKDALVETECNDISAGGLSFYSPTPPQSDSVVVALGSPPKFTHLIARIAHLGRVDHEGKAVYLIGCKYVGHATY